MNDVEESTSQGKIESARNKLKMAKEQLLRAKTTLDNDDYYSSLPPEEQPKALMLSMQIGPEILKIENAQIALIVDQVESNSNALETATSELNDALSDLQNFTRVLKAIGSVLGLVSKILIPV